MPCWYSATSVFFVVDDILVAAKSWIDRRPPRPCRFGDGNTGRSFSMIVVQPGDRVRVHYVIRFEDGTVRSSRKGAPLELIAGTEHRRLPGLGSTLVGLAEGALTRLRVPAEQAYGLRDATRVRQVDRRCFKPFQTLTIGKWVRPAEGGSPVRILAVQGMAVMVDSNHRWAGQTLDMEVELVAISSDPAMEPLPAEDSKARDRTAHSVTVLPDAPAVPGDFGLSPDSRRAVAFDVDAASLASLQQALPGWQVHAVRGSTIAALDRDWHPAQAGLLIVEIHQEAGAALALCRGLRSQVGRATIPLLALVPAGQPDLVRAALAAGATSCLVLPIHAKEVVQMLGRARRGRQPEHHTLHLDHVQQKDEWRDDGGQG
jgi:peptidylprolyl isomerase